MSQTTDYTRIDDVKTVSALKAPESNFQALAERAGDYVDLITHHHEHGSKVIEDDEGMIPHN